MLELLNTSDRLISSVGLSFKRYLFDQINWESRLIEILGSRGVGKTTLMLQKASVLNKKKKNQAVYISLDDILLFKYSIIEIAEMMDQNGFEYLFLDEVHKYPSKFKGFDWSAEIKNVYDKFPQLKIVYSGSSILKIYKGDGDLSRRKSTYHLSGLSFRENLALNKVIQVDAIKLDELLNSHDEITKPITQKIKILPLFREYLKTGYFPFYSEDKNAYYSRLNSILNVIIETDIPAITEISFETSLKIKKLLAAIASTVPYVPNLVQLRAELNIADQRTLMKYLYYLEKSEVISTLNPVAKGNKIMQKPGKILMGNTNYTYSLQMQNEEIGSIRETFFNSQLNQDYSLALPKSGDFLVSDTYIFEIGGKNKTGKQIKNVSNSYIVSDDIENGAFNQVPLWAFGLLY